VSAQRERDVRFASPESDLESDPDPDPDPDPDFNTRSRGSGFLRRRLKIINKTKPNINNTIPINPIESERVNVSELPTSRVCSLSNPSTRKSPWVTNRGEAPEVTMKKESTEATVSVIFAIPSDGYKTIESEQNKTADDSMRSVKSTAA
jgi:hypothetical protein